MKKDSKQSYYVYILLCKNNSYYTGFTTNLLKRYQSHLDGTGKCKYTRSFKPIRIAQCWEINGSKSDAMKLEAKIKRLSRKAKEVLIESPTSLCLDKSISHINTGELFNEI